MKQPSQENLSFEQILAFGQSCLLQFYMGVFLIIAGCFSIQIINWVIYPPLTVILAFGIATFLILGGILLRLGIKNWKSFIIQRQDQTELRTKIRSLRILGVFSMVIGFAIISFFTYPMLFFHNSLISPNFYVIFMPFGTCFMHMGFLILDSVKRVRLI